MTSKLIKYWKFETEEGLKILEVFKIKEKVFTVEVTGAKGSYLLENLATAEVLELHTTYTVRQYITQQEELVELLDWKEELDYQQQKDYEDAQERFQFMFKPKHLLRGTGSVRTDLNGNKITH
ncbi:hypothetical protein C518_2408 [Lysinibacillus fusiformis ZB2]|nr:hypothetical protein C518_2408 [Lysinibacillus fusiformis ZB2]